MRLARKIKQMNWSKSISARAAHRGKQHHLSGNALISFHRGCRCARGGRRIIPLPLPITQHNKIGLTQHKMDVPIISLKKCFHIVNKLYIGYLFVYQGCHLLSCILSFPPSFSAWLIKRHKLIYAL